MSEDVTWWRAVAKLLASALIELYDAIGTVGLRPDAGIRIAAAVAEARKVIRSRAMDDIGDLVRELRAAGNMEATLTCDEMLAAADALDRLRAENEAKYAQDATYHRVQVERLRAALLRLRDIYQDGEAPAISELSDSLVERWYIRLVSEIDDALAAEKPHEQSR